MVPGLLIPSLRPDVAILRLERPAHQGIYLISRKDRDGLAEARPSAWIAGQRVSVTGCSRRVSLAGLRTA